jgi:hypothetical protein
LVYLSWRSKKGKQLPGCPRQSNISEANKTIRRNARWLLRPTRAYDSLLHGWMFKFQGVATKYLENYLGWHRWIDRMGAKAKAKQFLESALG